MNTLAPKRKRSTVTPAPATSSPSLRVYLRQSVGEDRNTHGVGAQRSICERFAVERGLPWAGRVEYVDVGFSRDDGARPEFLRLLQEAAPGDTIVIWERSRLGVDLDYAVAVRDLVQRRGAKVITASGDPIDASETGLVMEHMRANADGNELRRIRTRTREKLRERVLRGYVGGPLPFGLETYAERPGDPSSWKLGRVVPGEAAVVVRIASLYADGAGYVRIAQTLNADGVSAPGGGAWAHSLVWDVLNYNRPVYQHGLYEFGARGGKGGKFPPVSYTHSEWKIGTDELWARVEAAHASRTRDMKSAIANAAKHAFCGPGRCGVVVGPNGETCGAALSIQVDGRPGKKVRTYQCGKHRRGKSCPVRYRIRAEVLEAAVRDALVPWFKAAREAIRHAAREVEARVSKQAAPDVAGLTRELDAARAEQAKLVRLAVATGGEVDAVADALRAGQAKVKELEAQLTRASAPRTDARQLGRQIEQEANRRLAALEKALHGPDARDALHALFPSGLRILPAPDAFHVYAEGDVLPSVGHPDGCPTVGRIPFALSIPRAA